jgi:magnesium-transporting ATPase (P-type)
MQLVPGDVVKLAAGDMIPADLCLTAAKDSFVSQGTLTGERGIYLKQHLRNKLIEHKYYIDKNGEDLLEVLNWKWTAT